MPQAQGKKSPAISPNATLNAPPPTTTTTRPTHANNVRGVYRNTWHYNTPEKKKKSTFIVCTAIGGMKIPQAKKASLCYVPNPTNYFTKLKSFTLRPTTSTRLRDDSVRVACRYRRTARYKYRAERRPLSYETPISLTRPRSSHQTTGLEWMTLSAVRKQSSSRL